MSDKRNGVVFGVSWVVLMTVINPVLGLFYGVPIGLTLFFYAGGVKHENRRGKAIRIKAPIL